jgi:hypothetical protein
VKLVAAFVAENDLDVFCLVHIDAFDGYC